MGTTGGAYTKGQARPRPITEKADSLPPWPGNLQGQRTGALMAETDWTGLKDDWCTIEKLEESIRDSGISSDYKVDDKDIERLADILYSYLNLSLAASQKRKINFQRKLETIQRFSHNLSGNLYLALVNDRLAQDLNAACNDQISKDSTATKVIHGDDGYVDIYEGNVEWSDQSLWMLIKQCEILSASAGELAQTNRYKRGKGAPKSPHRALIVDIFGVLEKLEPVADVSDPKTRAVFCIEELIDLVEPGALTAKSIQNTINAIPKN